MLEHTVTSHTVTSQSRGHYHGYICNISLPIPNIIPLIGPTLEVFHTSTKVLNPTPWLSLQTPLCSNPDFPPGTNNNFPGQIWPHRDILATHLFHRGVFLKLDYLNTKLAPNHIPMWTYMQIRHFLSRPETSHH